MPRNHALHVQEEQVTVPPFSSIAIVLGTEEAKNLEGDVEVDQHLILNRQICITRGIAELRDSKALHHFHYGAPWSGGVWERVIRALQDAPKRFLGRSSLSYEELLAVLLKVEVIVNCHPLTQLCEDAEDAEALTLLHFLAGKRIVGLPASTSISLFSYTAHDLRRSLRYRDVLLQRLWTLWKQEYLRSAHDCQPSFSSLLHVGDLVVVGDESVSVLQLKLDSVVEAFSGTYSLEEYLKIAFLNVPQVCRAAQRLSHFGGKLRLPWENVNGKRYAAHKSTKKGAQGGATREHATRREENERFYQKTRVSVSSLS
ncbi:hypothetical protein HPB51_014233 [Rhipicephalus microplus]|uniref:Uncharacterized protein n=1 Tax=Rhipicephalus microplus TaxID=6941 RepID=A0A9J6D5E1_RHIMP|nr:hypothetical protein HPB51_014233 [Rhipicephalus microplus]